MSASYRIEKNKARAFSWSVIGMKGYLIFLFLGATIYFPKLDLGFATVYIFEFIFLFTLLLQPFWRLFKAPSLIEKTYFYYALLAFFSWFVGALVTNFVDTKGLLTLFKYLSYLLLIPFLRINSKLVSEKLVLRSLFLQYMFVILAGGYVFYNMAFTPVSLGDLIWNYSPEYRLIGLTGQALGLSGLSHVGNTSVQMGVHLAFLLLLSVSLFVHTGKRQYALMAFVTFIAMMLTYSRSGLLVALIGVAYILLEKLSVKLIIKFLLPAFFVVVIAGIYFDIWEYISSFGVFGKLSETSGIEDGSAQQRIIYVRTGLDYLLAHPYFLLFGTGFGEEYSYFLIGTPHLESLIFTTLFQVGILGVSLLVLHFVSIWRLVAKSCTKTDSLAIRGMLYGCKIYIPGFFLANVVGGNSLQTDFMAPFFYGILGCCIVMVSRINQS